LGFLQVSLLLELKALQLHPAEAIGPTHTKYQLLVALSCSSIIMCFSVFFLYWLR